MHAYNPQSLIKSWHLAIYRAKSGSGKKIMVLLGHRANRETIGWYADQSRKHLIDSILQTIRNEAHPQTHGGKKIPLSSIHKSSQLKAIDGQTSSELFAGVDARPPDRKRCPSIVFKNRILRGKKSSDLSRRILFPRTRDHCSWYRTKLRKKLQQQVSQR